MSWTFRLADRRVFLLEGRLERESRPNSEADEKQFRDWAERYERAVRANGFDALFAIGREISGSLGLEWMEKITGGMGPVCLDIETEAVLPAPARAFLDVPWELMTDARGFLALDAARPFCVQRRLGRQATPAAPKHKDLFLMFMAASPRDVKPVLDYEAEEAGILSATEGLPLALTVEESGCLAFLRNRLSAEGPFEVVHLTCHGTIEKDGPKLMLESPEGDLALASAEALVSAFGQDKPGLMVLSACRTAEHGAQSASLAVSILRSGVPAVLGWDGSVYDTDANIFAGKFYDELARYQTPAFAAAKARQHLLKTHLDDPTRKACRHWHLARLYVNAEGGAAICRRDGIPRPNHRGAAYRAFLDKERSRVPVAGPMAFVGRRREAQDVLRAFRDRQHLGVLIHGFGGQGKSSLAARIADRLTQHRTVVIFEQYDANAIFNAVLQAVPPDERLALQETWHPAIAKNEENRPHALEAILSGPCSAHDPAAKRQPLLLIIDDLETSVLEEPAPGVELTPVRELYRAPLRAVLEAFARANTQSLLLLTSRYPFALRDNKGADLAARLYKVPLQGAAAPF